jgi:carbon monoxide dehydrogenase subunit G
MKLEQSFEVAAPIDHVWSTLIDIERVAPCLPGAAVTGRNDDGSYNGTFRVKIGPTSASYSGKLEMDDLKEDAHTATMHAAGTDKRGQGGAKATIKSKLTALGDAKTRVEVDTDYHITGRLARFGRGGMIEDISERLLGDFAKCLQTSLAETPDLSAAAAGTSGVAGDRGAGTDDADRAVAAAGDGAPIETSPGAVQAEVVAAEAEVGAAEAEAAGAAEVEVGAAEAEAAGAAEVEVGAAEAEAAGAAEVEVGAAEAEVGAAEAEAAAAAASAPAGANGGTALASGGERVGAAAPVEAAVLGAGESTGAAGTGGPDSGVKDAPVQSTEPLDGLSLVGSVLWGRAKGNPAPFAFVVGLLVALLAFRRARRSG